MLKLIALHPIGLFNKLLTFQHFEHILYEH